VKLFQLLVPVAAPPKGREVPFTPV